MSTRDDPAGDLDDDLREHLALDIQDRVDRGASPAAARAAALRALGSRGRIRADVRAVWVPRWLDDGRQDLRYALRTLWRYRAFSLSAIATLALALGTTTATVSLLGAIVLRPLPYPAADRLVTIQLRPQGQSDSRRVGLAAALAWQREARAIEALAVFDGASATLGSEAGAEKISIARVSAPLFPLLGVTPARGRVFTVDDERRQQPLAVISHRMWRDRLGLAPDVLGLPIVVDGRTLEVVGVMPADASLGGIARDADVFVSPAVGGGGAPSVGLPDGPWNVLARLRSGVSRAAAAQELTAIARARDGSGAATGAQVVAVVTDLHRHVVTGRTRLTLATFAAASACMLLIALANIVSLSLARSVGRVREMALRASLGATPSRLVRQMVVESLVLAGWAGVAGVLLAATLLHVLPILLPPGTAHLDAIRVEPGTWVLGLTLAILSGLALSLAPCWLLLAHGSRSAAEAASRTSTAGLTPRRVRGAVMVAEFALAVTLVGGAALLVRSWWAVTHVDRGFRSDRVVVMALSTTAYDTPSQRAQYYEQVLDVVAAVPEVEALGVISEVIVTSDADGVVTIDGPAGRADVRLRMRRDEATAGAFEAIGAPLRRGRWFSHTDRPDSPPVLLINEAMASRLWPGLDPIGRRLTFDAAAPQARWFTVVGVVADMRRQGLERPPVPESFEAVSQNPPRLGTLLVRIRRHASPTLAARLRAAVQHVDPKVPVYGLTMLDQRLDEEQWQRQAQTWLLVGVASIALLMAATGIYGLTLHTVAARTREIGIRRALGADASRVLGAAVGEGVRLCALGVTLGLVGAYLVGRTASGLLFGVGAADPIALAATVAALALVTLIACYAPARRALRVSPAVALRES